MFSSKIAHAEETPLESFIDFSKQNIGKLVEPSQTSDKEKQSQAAEENQKNKSRTPKPIGSAKEVEDAAEFAAKATGVRKDFLMGVLVVESNLGKNSGQCSYQEVEDGASSAYGKGYLSNRSWNTFQKRRDLMKNIAGPLGYDYEQLKVSCNPGYAGTGGAMGISQFMPDIWLAYEDQISEITGQQNPDPWNAKDAVVAMALLLGDTPGVKQHNLYAERNAAKMYLSGTTSAKYDWYANQIAYWSQNYSKLVS